MATIGETQQENTEKQDLLDQKPTSWNIHRNQCPGRKNWTIIDKLLEAEWGLSLRNNSQSLGLFESFTSCSSTSECQEKNPLVLLAGGWRKDPFWNTAEYSAPDKLCSQEKLFNQSLSELGEGKYPVGSSQHGGREIPNFSPFYVIFSRIKEEGGLKSTGKVVPGGIGSLKDRPIHRTI